MIISELEGKNVQAGQEKHNQVFEFLPWTVENHIQTN